MAVSPQVSPSLSIRILVAGFLLIIATYSLYSFKECKNCSEKDREKPTQHIGRTLQSHVTTDNVQEITNPAAKVFKRPPPAHDSNKIVREVEEDKNIGVESDSDLSGRAAFKGMTRMMYKDKIETLKGACKNNNIQDNRHPRMSKWFFSRDKNILFCLNAKAASTTMKNYFTYLLHMKWTPMNPELKKFKINDKKTGEDLKSLSKQGLKSGLYVFTVVRHPFSHLVSAYWKFTGYKAAFDGRLNEAFRYHNVSTDQPLSPSQMAEFIVNRNPWGRAFGHFRPYQKSCDYCNYDFDAIVDVDELEERIQLIANGLNVTEWQKPSVHANTRPKDPNDAIKFFSNITLSMAKQLHEFYRLDFEMFGYDPEPYYKYCQQ